jgi:hypothetical protein
MEEQKKTVPALKPKPYTGNNPEYSPCPDCKQTGEVELRDGSHDDCPLCVGLGWVSGL